MTAEDLLLSVYHKTLRLYYITSSDVVCSRFETHALLALKLLSSASTTLTLALRFQNSSALVLIILTLDFAAPTWP